MFFHPVADYHFPTQTKALKAGVEVAYTDLGAGPDKETLLFLHGLSSYIPFWQKNLPVLSKQYRCIAVDLPGFGRSSKQPLPDGLVWYTDVLADFLTLLGIDSVTLVGHSMGGQIAAIFALRYAWRVNKLALVAPAGFEVYTEAEQARILQQFDNFPVTSGILLKYFSRVFAGGSLGKVPNLEREQVLFQSDSPTYARTLARCITAMLNEPIYPFLPQITAPTWVCFGTDDRLIPNPVSGREDTSSLAKEATHRLPKGKLTLIPGAGHFLPYEYPTVFNDQLEQFLES